MKIKLSWTLWYAVALLAMPLMLPAQPSTQPTDKPAPADPADQTGTDPIVPEDAVIQLPDGTTLNLADLQKDGMAGVMVMKSVGMGDGNSIQIHEGDRKITINESDEEIVVTIKEGDGEPTEYRAANAEELEKNHPEAFEVYQRYGQDFQDKLPGPGMGGMGQFNVRFAHGDGPFGPKLVESLGARCMPVFDPFVKSQLGCGVMVMKVDKDSEAALLGLQRHDLIKCVNGKVVEEVEQLEEALAGADKARVDVIRAGKPLTLEAK